MNLLLIIFGKLVSLISKKLNMGHGSTWPGHLALSLNKNFVKNTIASSSVKTIFITGTNGKTTTSKIIESILKESGKSVLLNSSGANLLNGIASSIIINSNILGKIKKDYAIFEIDENALSQAVENLKPDYIVSLNLFRDQLDRYGELDSIIKKWKKIYEKLEGTTFILNADDPQISFLGNEVKKRYYFGLNNKELEQKKSEHASDSIFCPNCGNKLKYDSIYFSHLGNWKCTSCGLTRPKLSLDEYSYYPLSGTYGMYDTLAGVLLAKTLGIKEEFTLNSLKKFKPAFGRQEILKLDNKFIKFFLSKNPISFNESLKTIDKEKPKNLLIILNDRIPDGTDVSWIWDVDFETLLDKKINIFISGDRVYDLALRLKYAELSTQNIYEDLEEAIKKGLSLTNENQTFFILPTYSAMLDARKVLTGRKIL